MKFVQATPGYLGLRYFPVAREVRSAPVIMWGYDGDRDPYHRIMAVTAAGFVRFVEAPDGTVFKLGVFNPSWTDRSDWERYMGIELDEELDMMVDDLAELAPDLVLRTPEDVAVARKVLLQ